MEVARDVRRLAQRGHELAIDVVDLDRGQAQASEARCLGGRAHKPGERVARIPVTKAAEVDARENDLGVTLVDAPPDLAQHGVGCAAARAAADERDHAEVAREAAAVLDLHERPNALEPRVVVDAAERADVRGDRGRRVLAAAAHDYDVVRQAVEGAAAEVRGAAGHVHPTMRAGGAGGRLARLRQRLVRHTTCVDDSNVAVGALRVAVGEQPRTDVLRVEMRHLAAEKAHVEARHSARLYSARSSRSAAQPSRTRRARRAYRPRCGSSLSRYPEVTTVRAPTRGRSDSTSASEMFATATSTG